MAFISNPDSKSKSILHCDISHYNTKLVNRFNEAKLSLFEIFRTLGEPTRKQAKEYILYYDFHPFNSTEPILLALMVKDPETNKTIWKIISIDK